MRDIGVTPDWGDISVVYDRMMAYGLLDRRCPAGSVAGHILSVAVFARAARREIWWEGFRSFLHVYCACKDLNESSLLCAIYRLRRKQGVLQPDPVLLLEVLSR